MVTLALVCLPSFRLADLGVRTRVSRAGIDRVQTWAVGLMRQQLAGHSITDPKHRALVRVDLIPDYVRNLGGWVSVRGESPEDIQINIEFGGGFQHEGVIFVLPEHEPLSDDSSTQYYHWREGVYGYQGP